MPFHDMQDSPRQSALILIDSVNFYINTYSIRKKAEKNSRPGHYQ